MICLSSDQSLSAWCLSGLWTASHLHTEINQISSSSCQNTNGQHILSSELDIFAPLTINERSDSELLAGEFQVGPNY